jgi:hypothetical protein
VNIADQDYSPSCCLRGVPLIVLAFVFVSVLLLLLLHARVSLPQHHFSHKDDCKTWATSVG